jgi:hypothetical protein
MDILNFISWIRGRRQVTLVDPAKTLIPIGLKDGRRDDEYLAGAISVEDFATQLIPAAPYKSYTAVITQSGTNNPTATVLYNNTTLTFNWVRFSAGVYYAQPAGINYSKVVVFINPGNDGLVPLPLTAAKSGGGPIGSAIWLYTQEPGTGIGVDSELNSASLEVRVYQ